MSIESETAAEVAKQREAETAASRKAVSEAVLPAPPAPRPGRTQAFDVDVRTGDGHCVGKFVSRILTVGEQLSVGNMRAKLLAGLTVDPETAFLAEMVSHLQHSLVERPAWAADLLGFDDSATVEAIYREVTAHEASFRRDRAAS